MFWYDINGLYHMLFVGVFFFFFSIEEKKYTLLPQKKEKNELGAAAPSYPAKHLVGFYKKVRSEASQST